MIGKDGTITQTARLGQWTYHVGPNIKSMCKETRSCGAQELSAAQKVRGIENLTKHELQKSYPNRYPTSQESIGIEVVSEYEKSSDSYAAPTKGQTASLKALVGALRKEYGLSEKDVLTHSEISYKAGKEGSKLEY